MNFYASLRKEIMKELLCEKLVTEKHQCQVNSEVYKNPAPVKLILCNLLSVVRTYFHFSKILLNANVFYVQIQHKAGYVKCTSYHGSDFYSL